jgi:hypothetical protein
MGSRLIFSEDGVSEVVGYMLLLGIIVTSVGLVSVLAIPIIEDAKENAYLKNMEQGFTVLDSKVSLVALGKSPTQLVQMYSQKGDITVYNQTSNRMTVSFSNKTGTSFELYNESIGTIQYQLGENMIAYEGGGVFRKYPGEGDPITITPPEFHYNGETLTLPIIKVEGNQSTGGSGVLNIFLVSDNIPNVLYPNPDFNSEFTNPLMIGQQINVVIKSDYYMAWADYIEQRTEATVTTNAAAKEVRVSLNAKPNEQDQDLTPPVDVFGFNVENETALGNFSMLLANGTSSFKLKMTTSETSTEPYFTFYADKSGGLGPNGVSIELIYYDLGDYEQWTWDVQALKIGSDFDIDFLDNNGNVVYKSVDPSWTWTNTTYDKITNTTGPGGQELFYHYMSLVGPTFSFSPFPSPYWDGFNPDTSSYVLYYDVMPPRITYMHVVEHELEVSVG